MLAKTLRVHLVVNSKMRKMKIKTNQVVAFTAVLISVIVILLVFLTPLNPVYSVYDDEYAITGQWTSLSLPQPSTELLVHIHYIYLSTLPLSKFLSLTLPH